jgi:hypothetical protein
VVKFNCIKVLKDNLENAMTILENKNFIEGIFQTRNEAEQYLGKHPQKEKCLLKDMQLDTFPIYILEIEFGNFLYFSSKESANNYLNTIDIENIKSIILYIIEEPYICSSINQDEMGLLDHEHIKSTEYISIEVPSGKTRYFSPAYRNGRLIS